MSNFDTITLHTDDRGVATLTLARPEKHNALNSQMIRELRAAARSLHEDDSIRAVVLAAAGKSFCAGGDLGWMREQADKDREGRMAESTQLAAMLADLDGLPKPVIARVHGQAYGGGIGMMSVCDIVIVATSAKFGLTEPRLGLLPATISPYVVRRLGERSARRIFMNARLFDADEAVHLGLASAAVEAGLLDAAIEAELQLILQCAPGAVAACKALCQKLASDPGGDHLQWTAEALADRWETDEAAEGISAFFERRKPGWR